MTVITSDSWDSISRSDKNAAYAALILISGLIMLDVYFRPKLNERNYLSLDPVIMCYDLNRNGKIEEKELESIVKDLQNFSKKKE